MFNKIKYLLNMKKAKNTPSTTEIKRSHHRWSNSPDQFQIEIDGESYEVKDISYGGLQIFGKPINITSDVKLKFLFREIPVSLEEVYATDMSGGYRFIHNDSNLLVFLRPILENIRKGNTAQIIQTEFCKDPYNSEEWTIIRAEGPIDISINNIENTISYTYLSGKDYKNLKYVDNEIQIFSSIDEAGTSSRMEQNKGLNRQDAEQVIAQIQGIMHQLPKLEILEKFGKELIGHIN